MLFRSIASLVNATTKEEHMVFPHLRETFRLAGAQHDNIRPSGTTILENFEKLSVNAIEGMDVKRDYIRAMVHSMSSDAAPRNLTATNIPIVFHLHNNESNFKLLPLPKGKEYLLCMGLHFNEIKRPFKTCILCHFHYILLFHLFFIYIYFLVHFHIPFISLPWPGV